jgi:predicted secreted protein
MRRWGPVLRYAVAANLFVAAVGAVAGEAVPVQSESYSGTLPCADCSGIKTILTLVRNVQGSPISYTMLETYVGRPAAGTRKTNGTWKVVQGDAADKKATVYQLHEAGSKAVTSFLKVDDSTLRLLDGSLKLPASVPHTLKLLPAAVFRGGMAGGEANLKVGVVMEVRLDANHTTGHSWVAVPVADPVVVSEGKAEYLENAAENKVGAGGVEVWRFKAVKTGKETLHFEYCRPWEKNVPAAKTVTFQVTVQ